MAGPEVADERYWHPDGGEPDLPGAGSGSPRCPACWPRPAARSAPPGLGLPWYAVHGNHDNMLQGTVPALGWLHDFPSGGVKYVTPPGDLDAGQALAEFDSAQGDALMELARAGGCR